MWNDLLALFDRSDPPPVAVVGDFMLDAYLYGDAERMSPEAPVPVLRVVREEVALGGAGSVAANVAALGSRACCFGIAGDDDAGRDLARRLAAVGAETRGVLTVAGRPTTRKTRLIGLAQHRHRQQMIRIDAEDPSPIDSGTSDRLCTEIDRLPDDCRVICLQDYAKGVITPQLAQAVIAAAHRAGRQVVVDPARITDYERYAGATLITPNRTELELVSGRRLPSVASVREAAGALLRASRAENLCVTLDAEGIALISADGSFQHIPTRARDVYDVTGAGDAVLAAAAVALALGADLPAACTLANVAGGLEVEKFGCVPITRDELCAELLALSHQQLGKCRDLPQLLPELSRHRARGRKVVFTNGCFDLLHPGHIEYFNFCRQQGDLLVVGLNTDASVRAQQKGTDRPILDQQDRQRVLAALADVDYVVLFDEPTPESLIGAIRPDVLVKGEDWAARGVVGKELVESYGGRVVLAKLLEGYSTTKLIERIRRGGG